MTPSRIRPDIVADRVAWTRKMVAGIRALPISDKAAFLASPQTAAAAESYLRRALEALLDLGRHLLSKGFGLAVVEYREIATKLGECGVLNSDETALMRDMAGYRNRMAHFYDEVSEEEIFNIVTHQLTDFERVLEAIVRWVDSPRT